MSFSVANLSNLRFIYESEVNEPIEITDERREANYNIYFNELLGDMNTLIENANSRRLGLIQAPPNPEQRMVELVLAIAAVGVPLIGLVERLHAVAETLHITEKLAHLGLVAAHQHEHGSPIQGAVANIRGNNIKIFTQSICQDLTYRFHHELVLLSENRCKELAFTHFFQIKACLEECSKSPARNTFSATDLSRIIMEYVDPHPKQEIEKRMQAYIEERERRSFRSQNFNREMYLIDLNTALKNENTHTKTLIREVSSSLFFRDDWFSWLIGDNSQSLVERKKFLGLQNRFLTEGLTNYQGRRPTPQLGADLTDRTFNNPFFTAKFHSSMKEVTEDIVLLLMRLHITEVTNGSNPIARTLNENIVNIIHHIAYPDDKRITQKMQEIVTEVLRQREQVAINK